LTEAFGGTWTHHKSPNGPTPEGQRILNLIINRSNAKRFDRAMKVVNDGKEIQS